MKNETENEMCLLLFALSSGKLGCFNCLHRKKEKKNSTKSR
ncbi:hypothetical protein RU94_GL000248 [Enterococcus asini]|nr:hypothetical protein RU94_GL000248 [Enterococcus asini]